MPQINKLGVILFKTYLFHFAIATTFRCDRTMEGQIPKMNPGNYQIEISGNPITYVSGEQYTVFLRSGNAEKFSDFILTVENGENGEKPLLQLYGDSSTKFSDVCPNTVIATDSQPKSEIQVLWLAPATGSGCITFKAAIAISTQIWYNEDGPLTKIICENLQDSEDFQPNILKYCCACDEAKYESEHIRTIIKARGISYPNITGKTFAVFRVDNRHHLMSIVSMIDPSPDWIVGVSSLELCQRNCSWIESKVLNLYPWDAGTDDGVTYISPNKPSSPRQAIKRIKPNSPNDPRSPFFDASGAEMKPLARLYLSRQRLYEKVCDPSIIEDSFDDGDNCETEEWSDWSPCSATCGRGVKYKQRRYKNEESKYICHKKLTERAGCEAVQKYCPHMPIREIEDPMCEVGPWSEWSSCSVSCGKGTKTRDRKYKNRLAAKTCAASKINPPKMQENMECLGEAQCDDEEENPLICNNRPWSQWSPCSSTCGKGFKVRYRLSLDSNWPFLRGYEEEEFDEDDPCSQVKIKETVECFQKDCPEKNPPEKGYVCSLPKDVGACKSNIDRWYFNNIKGNCEIFSYSGCEGNSNNFKTPEQCQKVCSDYQKELIANLTAHKKQLDVTISGMLSYNIQNDAINGNNCVSAPSYRPYSQIQLKSSNSTNCELTKWSNWSHCNITGQCGYGYRVKYRQIKTHPSNGGKMCTKKLMKRKKCHIPCNFFNYDHFRIDCVMTAWTNWTKCPDKCIKDRYQERHRQVLVHPTPNGTPCGNKIEQRLCFCGN